MAALGLKPLHVPDAVVSPQTVATTGVLATGGLLYGLRRLQSLFRERTSVLMGSMAAFVFAAQMVNFPLLPLPISGHLLGGVLSAILLGPWAGVVVIAAVLIVQRVLFGDGGLTALGANFVNMGLIGSVVGSAIYRPIRQGIQGRGGVVFGGMIAAWFSVILASGAFAVELAASGRYGDFWTVLGGMALVHAAIGSRIRQCYTRDGLGGRRRNARRRWCRVRLRPGPFSPARDGSRFLGGMRGYRFETLMIFYINH